MEYKATFKNRHTLTFESQETRDTATLRCQARNSYPPIHERRRLFGNIDLPRLCRIEQDSKVIYQCKDTVYSKGNTQEVSVHPNKEYPEWIEKVVVALIVIMFAIPLFIA